MTRIRSLFALLLLLTTLLVPAQSSLAADPILEPVDPGDIIVAPVYDVVVEPITLVTNSNPQNPGIHTLLITNTGTMTDYFYLELTSDYGWFNASMVEPFYYLAPGASAEVRFTTPGLAAHLPQPAFDTIRAKVTSLNILTPVETLFFATQRYLAPADEPIALQQQMVAAQEQQGRVSLHLMRPTSAISSFAALDFATRDGTAQALDYTTKQGRVIFYPGEATKPLTFTLAQDHQTEETETFFVDFANPLDATLAFTEPAELKILKTPVIPDTTAVLDATTASVLVEDGSDGTLVFGADTPFLQSLTPGDVLVGGVSPKAPQGFLRKVSAIERISGSVLVTTDPATLEEAIQDGAVAYQGTYQLEDSEHIEFAPGVELLTDPERMNPGTGHKLSIRVPFVDIDGDYSTKNDQGYLEGTLEMTNTFTFDFEIDWFELEHFIIRNTMMQKADLKVASSLLILPIPTAFNKTVPVYTQTLSPLTFWVGPVPVVIHPQIKVEIGASGELKADFLTGYTYTIYSDAGLEYRDDQWHEISTLEETSKEKPVVFEGSLELKAFAAASLDMMIYDITGPYVKAEAYLKFTAKTTSTPPWRLDLGLAIKVGAKLEVLSRRIADIEATVIDLIWTLATGAPPRPERISLAWNEFQATGHSFAPRSSADGAIATFSSSASNLWIPDTNGKTDIFVRLIETGETYLVSRSSNGQLANGDSYTPDISADGRFIVFASNATNLVASDTNLSTDIFVHDRATNTTSRVSLNMDGSQRQNSSQNPQISADGRYVSYNALVLANNSYKLNLYRYDRQSGQTILVSRASNGDFGNNDSGSGFMSANGRFIAFFSKASNLVGGNVTPDYDLFIYDALTMAMRRIDLNDAPNQGTETNRVMISADGQLVTFTSKNALLDTQVPDTNNSWDVFVYDRSTQLVERISRGSAGMDSNGGSWYPSMSADGRFVAFYSHASNLTVGDTNMVGDAFVYDREAATMTRYETYTGGAIDALQLSQTGSHLIFRTTAAAVEEDTNGFGDIYRLAR